MAASMLEQKVEKPHTACYLTLAIYLYMADICIYTMYLYIQYCIY